MRNLLSETIELLAGVGKTLEDIANVLSTPTWFSANELRLVADAMDALNISTADGWTTRLRLDEFERAGSSFTAAAFADYLRNLPNGGMQA